MKPAKWRPPRIQSSYNYSVVYAATTEELEEKVTQAIEADWPDGIAGDVEVGPIVVTPDGRFLITSVLKRHVTFTPDIEEFKAK